MLDYLGTFRFYSADVLLIALGVTLVTSTLKKTLFKDKTSRLLNFLPFALGLVFYAVFRLIVTASILPLTKDVLDTLEGGFACGCASTLYYVLYLEFKQGKSVPAVYPLLDGYVSEEHRLEVAAELCRGAKELEGDDLLRFVKDTVEPCLLPDLEEEKKTAFYAFLAEFLKSTKTE